jgi:hypothetical protein
MFAACGSQLGRRLLVLAAALVAVLALAPAAAASSLIARDVTHPGLKVSADGKMAMVTYYEPGRGWRHVLAWGAVNAREPSREVPQVKFKLDYTGGWAKFGRPVWKTFRDHSSAYDGAALPWLVVAKKAPNGSYWALQRWQRVRPCCGVKPWTAAQRAWELRLSHWTGAPADLQVWLDWTNHGSIHHLFGLLTYRGKPQYGFGSTSAGNPTDSYGRNVSVDSYNSRLGSGWKHVLSFLAHRPLGNFCLGFYARKQPSWYPNPGKLTPPGNGERYRATVPGPGVTPDVSWKGLGLPDYDPSDPAHVQLESDMNALLESQIAADPDDKCHGS